MSSEAERVKEEWQEKIKISGLASQGSNKSNQLEEEDMTEIL